VVLSEGEINFWVDWLIGCSVVSGFGLDRFPGAASCRGCARARVRTLAVKVVKAEWSLMMCRR